MYPKTENGLGEQDSSMKSRRHIGQQCFAAVLSLALAIWSIAPSFAHAPAIFETVQDHLEMIQDHGHSHGFEEDLYWAMHGHSHDVVDHDHSQAFLVGGNKADPYPDLATTWRISLSLNGPTRQFRIDRPPRV